MCCKQILEQSLIKYHMIHHKTVLGDALFNEEKVKSVNCFIDFECNCHIYVWL
ncbi:protein of unknown function [Clostridium beijerinckii]|nr:protein of unknown function [Clostridium beijerinckii]